LVLSGDNSGSGSDNSGSGGSDNSGSGYSATGSGSDNSGSGSDNTRTGSVSNNTRTGSVSNNTRTGSVYDNTVTGSSSNNTRTGSVSDNTGTVSGSNNTRTGSISNNTGTGSGSQSGQTQNQNQNQHQPQNQNQHQPQNQYQNQPQNQNQSQNTYTYKTASLTSDQLAYNYFQECFDEVRPIFSSKQQQTQSMSQWVTKWFINTAVIQILNTTFNGSNDFGRFTAGWLSNYQSFTVTINEAIAVQTGYWDFHAIATVCAQLTGGCEYMAKIHLSAKLYNDQIYHVLMDWNKIDSVQQCTNSGYNVTEFQNWMSSYST